MYGLIFLFLRINYNSGKRQLKKCRNLFNTIKTGINNKKTVVSEQYILIHSTYHLSSSLWHLLCFPSIFLFSHHKMNLPTVPPTPEHLLHALPYVSTSWVRLAWTYHPLSVLWVTLGDGTARSHSLHCRA